MTITEAVEEARTYMQLGLGVGVDLTLEQLEHAVQRGEIEGPVDVLTWIGNTRARLEEHHVD